MLKVSPAFAAAHLILFLLPFSFVLFLFANFSTSHCFTLSPLESGGDSVSDNNTIIFEAESTSAVAAATTVDNQIVGFGFDGNDSFEIVHHVSNPFITKRRKVVIGKEVTEIDADKVGKERSWIFREIVLPVPPTIATTPPISFPPNSNCRFFNDQTVFCNKTENLEEALDFLYKNSIRLNFSALRIIHSFMPILNLTLFHRFPKLKTLSVTNSNVTEVSGKVPTGLHTLNLANNNLHGIKDSAFAIDGEEEDDESKRNGSIVNHSLELENIILSYNELHGLPNSLLELKNLKHLRLRGNTLRYDYVWSTFSSWYKERENAQEILKDGDETFCELQNENNDIINYTVLGILKAKLDLLEVCKTVNKSICSCDLYALLNKSGQGYRLSYESPRGNGNIAIALRLDCSHKNLTELPEIPIQTWRLSVGENKIKDFKKLEQPHYQNLVELDVSSNEITSLEVIPSSFLDKYDYLMLRNNKFKTIPKKFIQSLDSTKGERITLLGYNFIDCDCKTFENILPYLEKHLNKFPDIDELYCKKSNLPILKNPEFAEVCKSRKKKIPAYHWIVALYPIPLFCILITCLMCYCRCTGQMDFQGERNNDNNMERVVAACPRNPMLSVQFARQFGFGLTGIVAPLGSPSVILEMAAAPAALQPPPPPTPRPLNQRLSPGDMEMIRRQLTPHPVSTCPDVLPPVTPMNSPPSEVADDEDEEKEEAEIMV